MLWTFIIYVWARIYIQHLWCLDKNTFPFSLSTRICFENLRKPHITLNANVSSLVVVALVPAVLCNGLCPCLCSWYICLISCLLVPSDSCLERPLLLMSDRTQGPISKPVAVPPPFPPITILDEQVILGKSRVCF